MRSHKGRPIEFVLDFQDELYERAACQRGRETGAARGGATLACRFSLDRTDSLMCVDTASIFSRAEIIS
jgi:hypothetical protein